MAEAPSQAEKQPEPFDPVDAISAILAKEDKPAKPEKEAETPKGEEVKPVEAKPEKEAAPAKEAKKEEVESISLDPDVPLFEYEEMREGGVKEKVKKSVNQLIAGNMMQADYQRKTAELARERDSLPAKAKEIIEPRVLQAQEALQLANQVVLELVAPELAGMDAMKMAQIAKDDPARYTELRAKQDLVAQTVQNLSMRQNQLRQQGETERQQNIAKAVRESVAILEKDVPGWNTEYYNNLLKSAETDFGLTHQEVANIYDPRVIKVLDAARKYIELHKAKPAVEKKVVTVPKVLQPGTPTQDSDTQTEKVEKAFNKLRKSGRVEDMADFLQRRGL